MNHRRAIPSLLGYMLLVGLLCLAAGPGHAFQPESAGELPETVKDAPTPVDAADPPPQVVELLAGLSLPGSLAIQPDTGMLVFAEHGTGRIRRLLRESESEVQATDILAGLPPRTDLIQSEEVDSDEDASPGTPWEVRWAGSLQIGFLDQHDLILAMGGRGEEEGWLRVYRLPGGEQALSADPLSSSYVLPVGEQLLGTRKPTGLGITNSAVFLVSHREDSEHWLAQSERLEDDLGPVADLIAPNDPAQGGIPLAITTDPQGNLVVGLCPSGQERGSGEIAFCHSRSGEVWVRYPTGLDEITSLAYHPLTGRLYALDFARGDSSQGGLFELVAVRRQGRLGVEARRILSLRHAGSMVFSASGSLYVAEWGEPEATQGWDGAGRLLRIDL